MKRILLSSAAVFAFAGAASADGHSNISLSGDVTLGYNDDVEAGFYWDAGVDVALSATLDNGLTAAASFDMNIVEDNSVRPTSGDVTFDDWEVSLTSATAGMYFGVTSFAAETLWQSAGDMGADNFSEADDEVVLRSDITFGNVQTSLSYAVADDAGVEADDDFTQLSVAAVGEFGNFTVGFAYQEESGTFGGALGSAANGDYTDGSVFGIFAQTSVAGFDVELAYAENDAAGTDSLGLEVGYTVGDVTLGAYYVSESVADDAYGVSVGYASGPVSVAAYFTDDRGSEEYALQGSYDVGNGLVITAGMIDGDSATDDDFSNYIVAEYDLGGGASVMASFADANVAGSDDIDTFGGYELLDGTTVEVSFAF
ncbi:porin [Octadecabacter sp. 1_MG-2023]|uniref:porin n=1 Tax=unclassified Octadecabacter TaxID=196158 RepID=UPI001C0996E5|nr:MULTISPECIES: porin [unclassified Octadecabacter]MBU2992160.1 porin [Octadecabacter sp. B2R22]MDO6735084.1 porin [Octadecabacter sp. 1_MG-2023]